MFIIDKHAVFTLFAFILIKNQCNADDDETVISEEALRTVKPRNVMDRLQNLNMSYYCKFQANDYACNDLRKTRRFYYDLKLQTCLPFEYGYCDHSYNMFTTRLICLEACRDESVAPVSENATANIYCRYQPDFGDCDFYQPSFYYDIFDRKCRGFAYSGCGGNRNRFSSIMKCTDICDHAVRHREVKT